MFISFAASIVQLAHGEKSRTQSLTQSPSLIDAMGTEAFASKYIYCHKYKSCSVHTSRSAITEDVLELRLKFTRKIDSLTPVNS